jgi:hAT family C-terminal dimerisation region
MIQHQFEYPVLCLMARDYLAIPATTCIAEHSFLLSGRTDDPRQRQMNHAKCGGLQKLCAGYLDGQLSTEDQVMQKYIGDFSFNDDDYSD